jgi:predicted aspartyl protease
MFGASRKLEHLPEKNLQWFMGITHVKAVVFNLTDPSQRMEIELLVDSGAMYTIVPARVLTSLAIRPHSERVFLLADGRQVTWPVGNAGFTIGERQGASTIVFGSDGAPALLGIATLEELGLGLDPIRRELIPIPLPLFLIGR